MPEWLLFLFRSLGLFVIIFFFMRVMGKKHPTTSPFRFVANVVIAVLAALIIMEVVENLALGLVALGVWLVLPLLFDYLALRSKAVHDLLHGKETVLIKQGKIMEENLEKVRLTGEDLLKDLRAKDVFSVADVEFAVLETSGDINVMLKSDKKPITAFDMEWKVMPQTEPQTVILDGNVLHDPLTELGLTRSWIQTQLESSGVSLDNVFLGQVNSAGELYLDVFDDSMQLANPSVREMLFANLQKAEADLEKYAYETQDQQARDMFSENAQRIHSLTEELRPYLLR
ncbi:DUF421 domain-containing protein [Dethiobacter alkaliphilus]|uniref:YetF C-terminal domain-containing protein n=1 Tax=Dethiobacter alkaliphilus AHT 1 TaxID=555088 RepID=C0GC45_DETAL|nr:DUF421 domain-containing protein [Dethiobacter alkaliphilus]EEG78780.1 protein of unknown function DUF421 [Dethiobacter alkaliphilus AHT 1]